MSTKNNLQSITIFQHSNHPVQNVPVQYDMNNSIATKAKLPSYYIYILIRIRKAEPPAVLISEDLYLDKENLNEAKEWLKVLKNLFSYIEEQAS